MWQLSGWLTLHMNALAQSMHGMNADADCET